MKVILKQRVEHIGNAWDTVSVKDGFARNYLFPLVLAFEATKGNLKITQDLANSKAAVQEKEKTDAQGLAKKLQNASFTLSCEANVDDKLYGSVDSLEVSKLLVSEGYTIDKKNVLLDEPIKSLGVYEIPLKLHPEVVSKIKVWVVKK